MRCMHKAPRMSRPTSQLRNLPLQLNIINSQGGNTRKIMACWNYQGTRVAGYGLEGHAQFDNIIHVEFTGRAQDLKLGHMYESLHAGRFSTLSALPPVVVCCSVLHSDAFTLVVNPVSSISIRHFMHR